MVKIKDVEDEIRDLINIVEIANEEELKVGEGKKIEDDTTRYLVKRLRALAVKVGQLKEK